MLDNRCLSSNEGRVSHWASKLAGLGPGPGHLEYFIRDMQAALVPPWLPAYIQARIIPIPCLVMLVCLGTQV